MEAGVGVALPNAVGQELDEELEEFGDLDPKVISRLLGNARG